MANYCLFLLHGAIFVGTFFAVPILGPTHPQLFFLPLLLAFFTNQHWSLLHECIHGSFHASRRVNNAAGRLLGIFFCASFTLVRFSHLLHHQVNRTETEQLEIHKGTKISLLSRFSYYFGLFFGLFLSELFGTFLFILPRRVLESLGTRLFRPDGFSSHVFTMIMNRKGKAADVRLDAILIGMCLAGSFVLYGEHWEILALFLLIRMVLVSFLDYLYHYGTPLGDPLHGYNLWLPSFVSLFLLHFNFHGVHHRKPGAPWRELPFLFKQEKRSYDGNYMMQALRQLRGLVPSKPRED